MIRKVPLDGLRIDLGPAGKAKIGDRAGFAAKFRHVGPSIMAKSIDDRIGVATLIELVKHAPSNIDLCAAFTVQEEIGLRGAKVAAQYFEPDMAIAVDSTHANDLPAYDGGENMNYNTKLGQGPAIYLVDGSTLHDPRLVRFLSEVGDAEKIPYQFRQPGGGTNSGAIQKGLAGIPTVWPFLKDYQKQRLLTFLDPGKDPLGAGYHIMQSEIAVGSGQFWGKGLSPGHPEPALFPAGAAHGLRVFGFCRRVGLPGLGPLVVVLYRPHSLGPQIARTCKDRFGQFLAVGVTALIFWQVFINLCMVTGLLPVVGIPLPLLSYGGSSLVTTMLALGILLNIRMRRFVYGG